MENKDESIFQYLSYVTLREAWAQLKVSFVMWVVISAIIMALAAFFDFGAEETKSFWSEIPNAMWAFVGIGAFTWFLRGEKMVIVFPKTTRMWFAVNVAIVVGYTAGLLLPSWAFIPVYIGIVMFLGALDELNLIGRENYRLLSEERDESA